jgi:Ca-activated chloride channel family protein
MKQKALIFIFVFTLLLIPLPARADGIIVPLPPRCDPCPPPPCPLDMPCPVPPPLSQLAVRYHHVTVTIEDQVAVTHIDQVFYNPNDWPIEGTYMFPLPAEAAVSDFTLWIDDQPVKGEVLSAEQARQKYWEIVNSLKDPALLEYADRGAVQARVFPIPPKGERRIQLEYSQALSAENGLVRYVYPLNTEKFSQLPLDSVSVSVDIRSQEPIRAVYSSSHEVQIDRADDQHVTAGYEAQNVTPDSDFVLYYSLGDKTGAGKAGSSAFHLLSYRDPSDPEDADGYFLVLLAPDPQASETVQSKDLLLVLDHSGSMEGEKFSQAQEALRYILRHLNPGDRFNVISFSSGVEQYAGGLRSADEAHEAERWVDQLGAQGSTDINRALLEAAGMVDPERPSYLIFLTDGLPTTGVVESQQILDNLARSAPENLRLFAFGVGYDVDTYLLDSLAQAHHGSSTYVQPGESIDEVLSGFYAKISTPVLTDLKLDFGGMHTYDLYPSPLPDLFKGSQIVAVGRYRNGGTSDVLLTGTVNGERQSFIFPAQHFAEDSREASAALAALPRLWATRKVGYLLNQVRLNGPEQETLDQIVRLSIRYGIVTPYTSYLVTEPLPLGAAEQSRIAEDALRQMQAMPTQAPSGQAAVEKAAGQSSLANAEAPAPSFAEAAGKVRVVGAHSFVLKDGTWIDTAYDPSKGKTVKVAFLSDDFFALTKANPELAGAFALGTSVIAVADGTAYEVVTEGSQVPPVNVAPGQTGQPQTTAAPDPNTTPGQSSSNQGAAQDRPNPLCTGGFLPLGLLLAGCAVIRVFTRRAY